MIWEAPGAARVLGTLGHLHLDYRERPVWDELNEGFQWAKVRQLQHIVASTLAAATRLHSLQLRVSWSDEVAALCSALPAIKNLRWANHPASWHRTFC